MPELEKLACPECGAEEIPNVIERLNGATIVYRAECPLCKRFIKWLPKSIFEGAKKPNGKRRKAVWTPTVMGIDHCELCGRHTGELGKNEKLDAHHKLPIEHGGEDAKDNILILCTPCHRMAHFLRTYLNDHLSHLYESGAEHGVIE